MSILEILLEGKYNYFARDKIYSEENFKLSREDKSFGNFVLTAQTMSRVASGEFLKVNVEYCYTAKFETKSIKVNRQMGPNESTEMVNVDHKTKTFDYIYTHNGKTQKFNYHFNNYVHLATPCFSTTMLMTQMKKIDPVHRTPYSVYTSPNIWEFKQEIFAQEMYVELQEIEPVDLEINGNQLNATHCKLLQVGESGTISKEGLDIYLSKYHGIPYLGHFSDGVTIKIERLKNYEANKVKLT